MTDLSVNLNAVAQLRNRRDVGWPNVCEIARIALDAGANGVTVHPRPDERHTRRQDVFDLADLLAKGSWDAEYNIEGYPTEDFLALVEDAKPDQVTLVPDDPAQSTSDHGWDVAEHEEFLAPIVARLRSKGMRVALFIDADPGVPAVARKVGAGRVELYTGPYGANFGTKAGDAHLADLVKTASVAREQGLEVNIGHDLTLKNLPQLIAAMPNIDEASIGHGLTADALIFGFDETVRRYLKALNP